jgi:hypothetical protein
MRPKIMSSRSIAKSLNYNEQKVTLGIAEFLTAGNFLKDPAHLRLEDKMRRLNRRLELNDRVKTSQHITLNFDPLDNLSNEQMIKISRRYMKEIGFERQPWLAYRHHDAGHPHCHIVTTHVQKDGNPIELYKIGEEQSESARLHIEAEFGLVTSEMKRRIWQERQMIDSVRRIKYGEKSTTQSLSAVLEYVTGNFKYTSLAEFNAVLRLYNVEAYRGKEGSQLYQHRGLLYRVLDEHGSYIGVPLKASFFDCKPTLANLEKQFAENLPLKERRCQHLRAEISWQLYKEHQDLESFERALEWQQIRVILQRDKAGQCKEVAYVDFRNKCALNGDELGKHGDRMAIQKIIDREQALVQQQSQQQQLVHRPRLRMHM